MLNLFHSHIVKQWIESKNPPVITFSENYSSREVENPTIKNLTSLKRIQRYINGSKNIGLLQKKFG